MDDTVPPRRTVAAPGRRLPGRPRNRGSSPQGLSACTHPCTRIPHGERSATSICSCRALGSTRSPTSQKRGSGAFGRTRELRPGFDREFGKDVLIRINGIELDIHRTFVTGPFGLTIPLEQLFASATPFAVGGRTLHALGGEEMFLQACYNAALGDRPVRWGSRPRPAPRLRALPHRQRLGVGDRRGLERHGGRPARGTAHDGHPPAGAPACAGRSRSAPGSHRPRPASAAELPRAHEELPTTARVLAGDQGGARSCPLRPRARRSEPCVPAQPGLDRGKPRAKGAPEPPGRWPCLSRCRAVSSSGTRLRCSGGWSTVCSCWARRRPFRVAGHGTGRGGVVRAFRAAHARFGDGGAGRSVRCPFARWSAPTSSRSCVASSTPALSGWRPPHRRVGNAGSP